MNIPTVELDLDRARTWRFSGNSVKNFHKVLGKNAFDRLQVFQSIDGETDQERNTRAIETREETLTVFEGFLWCGLLDEDPQLKIEAVGSFYTLGMMPDLLSKIMQLALESNNSNPITPETTTGSISGPSAESILDSAKPNSGKSPTLNIRRLPRESGSGSGRTIIDSLESVT